MTNSSLLSKKPGNKQDFTCWVLTEGMIGTENQCVGIAEALNLTPTIKKIGLRQPWKSLSPWLGFETSHTFTTALESPWPDLLIASGRKSIAAARYIKKQSKGQTFTVQVQDPKTNPDQFDLVAVPYHDALRGDNVIVTAGAPNKITAQKLEQAKENFAPLFSPLSAPRVAVLIGGNSRTHKLTSEITQKLCAQLAHLNASLMITTSRRTGAENLKIIENELTSEDNFIWDGTGDNPYLGMLASDAGTTGKPVYMIPLEGSSPRFNRLYNHLQKIGVLREFDGNLAPRTYEPLNDAQRVADAIKEHWDKV